MRGMFVVLGIVASSVLVACGTPSTKPQVKASAEPEVIATIAMPNVIGMLPKDAERTIENLFPNATAFTDPGGATYDYSVANRCLWTEPTGEMSSNDRWPVASVVLVLHPDMPADTSPTEPVQPGPTRSFGKLERLFFTLHAEKPSEVWCKPYGDVGPAGGAPHVDVPNHDDGGEPWFCRRHRWC